MAALTAIAGVGLWMLRRRREAVYVVGAVATGALVNTTLKDLFDRTRPPAALAAIHVPSSPSFPSGHTVSAFILFGALAVVLLADVGVDWRGIVLATAMALLGVLVGYSRLYLGVHWFTDVVAGWCLGTAWLALWTAGWVWAEGRTRRTAGRSGGPSGGSG